MFDKFAVQGVVQSAPSASFQLIPLPSWGDQLIHRRPQLPVRAGLPKLQERASENLVLVNRDKSKVLNVGQTLLVGRYRLRTSWLGSSPAERGLAILVDKSSPSWDFNTCRAALSI